MDRIASIPFPTNAAQAARAYGVRPVAPVRPVQAPARTEPVARIGIEPAPPATTSDPGRLVAARVDPMDPARDVAALAGRPADGSLPMYRHPADRNQAATAVALGRGLDVRG